MDYRQAHYGYDQEAPPHGGNVQPPPYSQPPPQGGYTQSQPHNVVVTQPGYSNVIVSGPPPQSYLVPSIIACIFCFWPTGICAIYFALQANTFIGQGNYSEAQTNADKARKLMIASVAIGAVWILIVIILQIVAATATVHNRKY